MYCSFTVNNVSPSLYKEEIYSQQECSYSKATVQVSFNDSLLVLGHGEDVGEPTSSIRPHLIEINGPTA